MPLLEKHLPKDRAEFEKRLTLKDIHKLSSDPDLRVLQCSSPVEPETWDLINEELLIRSSNLEIRVFGFYSSACDLSFVTRLKNLHHFSADCLKEAVGVENVVALQNLESLSIGIYNLKSFDFLADIPREIRVLSLAATKSKKNRLDHLARFRSLRTLYLEGQQNGIEVLSELRALEKLTLRSISTSGLSYITDLERLWSLDIKLGGIRDLSAIQGKTSIKYLELWQIQGLRDISVISTLYGLQHLFLQSLRNVIAIPDLSKLKKLRRLYLENMKALVDVEAIFQSPSLQEFIHVSAHNIELTQYADLVRMATLERVSVGFGNRAKNQRFERLMCESGIEKFSGSQFIFQ
jgi:hypothetical protein